MSKTMKKYEAGKAVAQASEGRIALTIEDSVATLRGEFTRKDRAPLRFKKGAGWRYKVADGVETWRLYVGNLVEPKPEPRNDGAVYVKWDGENVEVFRVSRSTESSVWLVGPDGAEFRKAIGESAERLAGGFLRVG